MFTDCRRSVCPRSQLDNFKQQCELSKIMRGIHVCAQHLHGKENPSLLFFFSISVFTCKGKNKMKCVLLKISAQEVFVMVILVLE